MENQVILQCGLIDWCCYLLSSTVTWKNVLGEAGLDTREQGWIVVAEMLEDSTTGMAKGAEAVEDGTIESTHCCH